MGPSVVKRKRKWKASPFGRSCKTRRWRENEELLTECLPCPPGLPHSLSHEGTGGLETPRWM